MHNSEIPTFYHSYEFALLFPVTHSCKLSSSCTANGSNPAGLFSKSQFNQNTICEDTGGLPKND